MINPKDFLPDLEKDLSTDAITDSVEIYRDKWGIPHIVAKNEHDLFFCTRILNCSRQTFSNGFG